MRIQTLFLNVNNVQNNSARSWGSPYLCVSNLIQTLYCIVNNVQNNGAQCWGSPYLCVSNMIQILYCNVNNIQNNGAQCWGSPYLCVSNLIQILYCNVNNVQNNGARCWGSLLIDTRKKIWRLNHKFQISWNPCAIGDKRICIRHLWLGSLRDVRHRTNQSTDKLQSTNHRKTAVLHNM